MMSTMERYFTVVEAGAVSGVTAKAVHNIIDKGLIALEGRPAPERVAKPVKGAPRVARKELTGEDLVRISIWYLAARELAPDARRLLVKAMDEQPHAKVLPAGEFLKFDVQAMRREVERRIRVLTKGDALVHRDRDILGGEPVFKGTRIPVHGVAEMLKAGAERDDLLSGYPALTPEMLEIAPLWAQTHPRRGRPRKSGEPTRKSSRRLSVKPDPLAAKAGDA